MARTLLVTNDFPPRPGGIQQFVHKLAVRQPADSLVVYASTWRGAAAFDAEQPFEVVREDTSVLLPTPAVARRAATVARARGCDTVWFGAAAPLGLLAPGLRRRAGIVRAVAQTHGHEVGWAALPGARVLEEGVRRYPQFPLAQYVGTMADGLERLARQQRTRLLHASSFHVTGLAAATAARRLGLPFIYEMRGLEDLMKGVGNPQFHTTERYRFLHHVETEVCHAADAVFVITDALRREMVRRGVPEEKLVVLPNGVHTDQFTPRERDRELEQLLRVEGLPVIGYAGSLVDYEGLELLMEAAAILAAQGVAFRVVVVGDGPAEASVQEAAYALALDDVVTFAGRVPHDDVPRYLSLFDITPFPRLPLPVCELISPMKPFEALAMGKAVVVSDVAALTEIITDEVTGLVFAKGDAADLARVLRRLIESPQLRSRVGTAGMNWVRAERDWSQVTATAADTYQQVLERHTQSREVRSAAP